MELKEYNPGNVNTVRRGKSYLRINSKPGTFSISKQAVDSVGIKIGDRVSLFQSVENKQDWFLAKSDKGFTIRTFSGSTLLFSSAGLMVKLLESLGLDKIQHYKFNIPLATEPIIQDGVSYYSLITAAVKDQLPEQEIKRLKIA